MSREERSAATGLPYMFTKIQSAASGTNATGSGGLNTDQGTHGATFVSTGVLSTSRLVSKRLILRWNIRKRLLISRSGNAAGHFG